MELEQEWNKNKNGTRTRMEQEQELNQNKNGTRTKTKLKNDVKKIGKDIGAEPEQHN